jgi:hypothetical protein
MTFNLREVMPIHRTTSRKTPTTLAKWKGQLKERANQLEPLLENLLGMILREHWSRKTKMTWSPKILSRSTIDNFVKLREEME